MKHSIKDQLSIELKSLAAGYPKFIYSNNKIKSLDGIPVFVFHTIEQSLFEAQLKYLKRNGYETLTIHEFYDIVTKKNSINTEKLVLLTIDDARSSVWRFAYPLLKKYQMHSTVFIIPGITEEGESCRLNLNDYWNSKCNDEDINNIDATDSTLCNWKEIREMYYSGIINIESHTLFHKEIFTNTNIVDFIEPGSSFIPYDFKGSPYFSLKNIESKPSISDFIGLPLFESAPLMLAGPKLEISPEFIIKCKNLYNECIKNNEDWKIKIKKFTSKNSENENYFTLKSNSREDVYDDLKAAREEIQNRLDNNAGNHLCLPWTRGNDVTVEICKELGIKSCFWGILENKKINKPGDDPYFISRIKNDFIFRLPGEGRVSLISIYKHKLRRRLSGEKIF